VEAYGIGIAAWRLGAGRARKEDPVSPGAGVVLRVRPGDTVAAGQPLLELRTDDESTIPAARVAAGSAVIIADAPPDPAPLLLDRIA
jgi:thymidine phosphorylase